MEDVTIGDMILAILGGVILGTVVSVFDPPKESFAAVPCQVTADELEVEAVFVPADHQGPIVAIEAETDETVF
jgi:hypothetical protein